MLVFLDYLNHMEFEMATIPDLLEIKFKDDSSASKKSIFANDAHQICVTVRLRALDGNKKTIKNFRPETIGGLTFVYASSGLRIPFFGFPNEAMTDNNGVLIQHKNKTKYCRDLPAGAFYEERAREEAGTPEGDGADTLLPVTDYAARQGVYYADELEWGNDSASGIFWMNIYFQARNVSGALGNREIYAVWQPDLSSNGQIFDSSGKVNAALKSTLTIDVLPAIDYGVRSNWQFPTSQADTHWDDKGMVEIKSKQKGWVGTIHDNSYEAKSRCAKFFIKSIPYQKNAHFSLESINSVSNGTDLIPVDTGVSYAAGDIKLESRAVSFYFSGSAKSDVYAIFVAPNGHAIGFSSASTQVVPLEAFNHIYRIQLHNQNIQHTDAQQPDGFAVYVWNLNFDMDDTKQEGWGNHQVDLVKLEVADVYGNHGVLSFDLGVIKGVLG
ncbi:hypothetical protein ACPRNU_06045 [Chromobacterium vaccinii]|uniref:hypothetical protein n=1 Tax=Chromobacterium vaccinii TaxID=1108595 RepID=UPI003C7113D6